MDSANETRDDVLHVPNLFDYFCNRTASDMRARGGTAGEAPAVSFASLLITLLAAMTFYIFGLYGLAKATFALFAVLMLWTIWGVVIRSSEQVSQKANTIKAGVFPPASAPFVLARLKWWNHLISPLRWGRYSRLFDRKGKLERKIAELEQRWSEATAQAGNPAGTEPPTEAEAAELAERITSYADRGAFEEQMSEAGSPGRLRQELLLHMALLHKLNMMMAQLERIDKLSVTFQNVSPDDLSQVVSEAIQILEDRRLLVLGVDAVDPDDFIDLVSVGTA